MARKPDFSIVLPTYTGAETIPHTLGSILTQQVKAAYEVVVVLDGPHGKLEEIVTAFKKRFESHGVSFAIIRFPENRGRFAARVEGARVAKSDQILFVDDRVELDRGFLKRLFEYEVSVAMPNVVEVEEKNRPISLVLRLIRKKVYGKKWGESFEDYYVDKTNFERSPEGTTTLWIAKQVFLDACKIVAEGQTGASHHTSDDTRVLRAVVDDGGKILRTSSLAINYRPRTEFKSEIKHLYGRGFRFVDYYLRPGTRFFLPLVAFYVSLALVVVMAFVAPSLLLKLAIISPLFLFLFAAYLADFGAKTFQAFLGISLIVAVFGVGILRGTLKKLRPGK